MINNRWNPKACTLEKRDFILDDFLFWPPRNSKKTALKFLQRCRASLVFSQRQYGWHNLRHHTRNSTNLSRCLFFIMCWVHDQPRRQTADQCSFWSSNCDSVELHVSWSHLSRRYLPWHWRSAGRNLWKVTCSANLPSCVWFLQHIQWLSKQNHLKPWNDSEHSVYMKKWVNTKIVYG